MAYANAPLMKKVFYIAKRKWEPNIQHDCKSGGFRAGFKVAEWGGVVIRRGYKVAPIIPRKLSVTAANSVLNSSPVHTQ